MKDSYVQAFTSSILTGTPVETALANLELLLKKKGHQRLWSLVLRSALRELTVKLRSDAPQVVLASKEGVSTAVLAAAIAKLGSREAPHIEVDPTLIGGFTARVKDSFIDASDKQKLLTLYRGLVRRNQ